MLFDAPCVACGAWPGPVCDECSLAMVPSPELDIEAVDVAAAAFLLDDRSRSIVAAFKYRRQRRLGAWLAASLVDHIPRAADAIVWVPATPERRRRRGFDQAEEIARAVAALTGVPAFAALERSAVDRRQTGQGRAARRRGPALTARAAAPPFSVVIDDVTTTGSSLRIAALELRNAGAGRVAAAVFAATPLRRDESLPVSVAGCSVHGWT